MNYDLTEIGVMFLWALGILFFIAGILFVIESWQDYKYLKKTDHDLELWGEKYKWKKK